MKVATSKSKYFNGYNPARTTMAERGSHDNRESFAWRYSPEYDPDAKRLDDIPEDVKPWLQGEDFVWDENSHLSDFKNDILSWWSACLTLARRMIQIFALALELPENYFDDRVVFPGADGVANFYPVATQEDVSSRTPGIGSHTDLQFFTILWQDENGGLQVLNNENRWIKAKPIPDTLVVNIGDFLMRMSNDFFKSTVHRVYNEAAVERLSMPFFFGLNFNCVEGVIPSCTSEGNPPKYKPIRIADWCQLRFKQAEIDHQKWAETTAPSAKLVAAK